MLSVKNSSLPGVISFPRRRPRLSHLRSERTRCNIWVVDLPQFSTRLNQMMSGVHFEEIEENVAQSEIVDSINFALDSVLLWLQRARGSQVVVFISTQNSF